MINHNKEDGLKLKKIFDKQIAENEDRITNYEKYASLTLPSEFMRDEVDTFEPLESDYQSIGGVAVNSLANKIMMTLFNVRTPFFRIEYTPEQKARLLTGTDK